MACPIVIYLPSHGLIDGNRVTVSGIEGLTDANGVYNVYDSDTNSFQLKNTETDAVVTSAQTYVAGGVAATALEGQITLADLGHLEGETVTILADGAVLPSEVVSDGEITFESPSGYSLATAGLPFRYTVKPMRLDIEGPGGSTRGTHRKIVELIISFLETLNARYGTSTSDLHDIEWRSTADYDTPPSLFTGDKTVPLDAGFDPEDPIVISGDSPLPCTVRAIVARVEFTGR